MTISRKALGVGVALIVLAGGTAALAAGVGGVIKWDKAAPPMSQPAATLAQGIKDDNVGFVLDPPGDGFSPGVSAETALDTAWKQEGAPGSPKAAHATLALLTWGDRFQQAPVWLITYEGGECQQQAGAPGGDAPCVFQSFNTFIDATTGEYLASYTTDDAGGDL